MKRFAVSEIEHILVRGRHAARLDPLALFWTGSGIELNVTGSELQVELTAEYGSYEPWIEIVIDGFLCQRRMLERGRQTVGVFRGMEKGVERNVRILKATQAPSSDPDSSLLINAVVTDGDLAPVAPRTKKLEVIGDSITSGEGLRGARRENSWNAGVFGAVGGYPYLLGELLDAEVNVISQSGYGVCYSWRGDPAETIPPYYEEVCGVLRGEKNEKLGAHQPWDFTAWQPDWIVINLGTNDSGAFDNAETFFEGENQTRLNADGSMNEADRRRIVRGAREFLKQLRAKNPESRLVWCYGMIGGRMEDTLREAVRTYTEETGDGRAEYFAIPPAAKEELGARGHPGLRAHEKAAALLAEKLRET
ncbi:MAG: GDSL family lipase [Oscillospiraceae bacterium]|nr:GDSL family lipase [Oscillospiraceae bacterium]